MEKLAENFNKVIVGKLKEDLHKKNVFEVPRIEKIVIASGTGDYKEDDKMIEKIVTEISKIAGQKAKVNKSRKAVSAFKLRIGQPVGVSVTLRGVRMYDFIEKLVNIALPRVRDFRGLSLKSFDNAGNYSIGIRDYAIFPEIKYEDVSVNFGLEVNIKTTAKDKEDAKALLDSLGFPFEKGK